MSDVDVRLDLARRERVGLDEAILCTGKSQVQLVAAMEQARTAGVSCLMTRLEEADVAQIDSHWRQWLDYDARSRTGFFNGRCAPIEGSARVAVVTAGSTDMPMAAEALRTLDYQGVPATAFADVGVAGLWRLTSQLDAIREYPVIICAAGMDGALPSVLGGLVPGVLIALPTSTGYGASRQGQTALHAALASCAPGLSVVNIDNGYGAACAAFRAIQMINRVAH